MSSRISPKEMKKIHACLNKFWQLNDHSKSVVLEAIGSNLVHQKAALKYCPTIPNLEEFLSKLLKVVQDDTLRQLLVEAMEGGSSFSEILYATDTLIHGGYTDVVLQSRIGGTSVILDAVVSQNPEVVRTQICDDRTVQVSIKDETQTFAKYFAKYGTHPMTDVRAMYDARGEYFERGIFWGEPNNIRAAVDEINKQNELSISRSGDGMCRFQVDQTIAKNPILMKILGLAIFDPKNFETVVSASRDLGRISVWNRRCRPVSPLHEPQFIREKAEELRVTANLGISGLSEIRHKRLVLDHLELNGFTINGLHFNRYKVRQLLYRAKYFNALFGLLGGTQA